MRALNWRGGKTGGFDGKVGREHFMGNWGHMRQGHFCKEKELWSGGGTKEQIESIFLGGVVLSFAFHWEICKKERERSLKALNWRGSGALWRDQK